jgi:hypothetical protein
MDALTLRARRDDKLFELRFAVPSRCGLVPKWDLPSAELANGQTEKQLLAPVWDQSPTTAAQLSQDWPILIEYVSNYVFDCPL